jgi:hypothetical protein
MRASGERPSAVAMRFGWGVLVGLSLALFMLAVPARYEQLAEVGRRPTRHQDREDERPDSRTEAQDVRTILELIHTFRAESTFNCHSYRPVLGAASRLQ